MFQKSLALLTEFAKLQIETTTQALEAYPPKGLMRSCPCCRRVAYRRYPKNQDQGHFLLTEKEAGPDLRLHGKSGGADSGVSLELV